MSKHRQDVRSPSSVVSGPELVHGASPPTQTALLATDHGPLATDQVEIGTCLGRMVACPSCGKPTLVTHARGARTVTQVISSKFWVLAKCSGFCGNSLLRAKDMVTLLPESIPVPVVKPLGAVVGHFVMCPIADPQPDGSARVCGAKAQAVWTMDEAHGIVCPVHGRRPYPGDMPCELVDVTESHVARTLTAPPKAEAKKRAKHTVVKHQGPFPGGVEYYFDLTYADGRRERINFNRAGAEIQINGATAR